MREFFRPFRRKLGIVALVVACALMVAWIRSVRIFDEFSIKVAGKRLTIDSFHHKVYVQEGSFGHSLWSSWTCEDDEIAQAFENQLEAMATVPPKTHVWRGGPRYKKGWSMNYWSIILPVAVLSAFLLLGKPRRQPKQPVNHA